MSINSFCSFFTFNFFYYLISDGIITNIDENQQKENKKEIIKEYKGEKAAKEVDTHKDIQLEAGIKAIKAMINKK